MEKFDLAIIGAGPAGYEAADFAARHGLKTVLIEKNSLGGTCLNSGCIPTKTLLHTAEMYHEVTTQAEKIGLNYSDFSVDMMKMKQRKDEVLCTLRDGIGKLMKMRKVTVLKGTGAIIGQNRISVADETQKQVIEADKILIATGSVPAVPPIQGAQYAVTSDELLNSAKAYESLVIIGGGVIGIEFASLYTALGKKVIIIEALDKILANMDKEFAQSLKMLLTKRGAQIHVKSTVTKIEQQAGKYICHYTEKDKAQSAEAECVLMAVGRRPYSANLFGEEFTVETDRSRIKVDENYQTSVPNIYAAGDVIGGVQLAHTATAEAINAICHMLGKEPVYDTALIPSCVYTNPEIASVGMTADEAKKAGVKVIALKYPMGANGKTVLSLQERSFIKVIAEAETKRVLGAQMMCARATDMISQFTQAIANKLTLEDMGKVIYPHPTFSEAIGKTVEQ